jgi:hypothetical protein
VSGGTERKDRRFPGRPRNECSGCGEDFNSVELFDRHRRGSFEPNDRYCLTVGEMQAHGWESNERGRWVDPARGDRAERPFLRSGLSPNSPSGDREAA